MEARLDCHDNDILQKLVKHINTAGSIVTCSTLPLTASNVALTRASRINDCAFCTDVHNEDAEHAGETSLRLNLVAAWRDARVFTDVERAASELTERGARIADAAGGVFDEAWLNAAMYDDGVQLATLVCAIAHINTYNKMNAIRRDHGGVHQPGQ